MKKILVVAILALSLLGCFPREYDAKVTNRVSGHLYVQRSWIVSDNATHLVITLPKTDGFGILYKENWEK